MQLHLPLYLVTSDVSKVFSMLSWVYGLVRPRETQKTQGDRSVRQISRLPPPPHPLSSRRLKKVMKLPSYRRLLLPTFHFLLPSYIFSLIFPSPESLVRTPAWSLGISSSRDRMLMPDSKWPTPVTKSQCKLSAVARYSHAIGSSWHTCSDSNASLCPEGNIKAEM